MRIFTMRKRCLACFSSFTIDGSAQKYCKNDHCRSKRRKADRLATKLAQAKSTLVPDSRKALELAVESGR